ncbi:phytanoyl-CoA dioxygenase family protein [Ruegeria sp. HKCCD8929]|uniref:phytanoyl-CoA dioxygenase family protein n=1 Tax=Ruegeria sp. HKCCD8929 TaxID=2683006 RepID=UPI001487A199|nr:phytanoyl-CoA dioxygenase family protein [Ruegeria sp. HKCCD8929]
MPTHLPLENGHLSDAQIAQYWEDGFLYPFQILPPSEAADLRAELERIEANWRETDLPLPLSMYKRLNSHVVMPMVARLARDPRILDVVQGILGPDLLIWSAEFFIKEPRTTQIVSMHQDLTYWGMGETSDQVTAWLALSPATTASGCMDLVAGSHRNPILPHNDTFSDTNLLSRGQEIAVEVADKDKTHIELQPGQMSLHHGLTIHGSGPNASDDRRIGMAIRYLNPNARQQVADRDYAMLARGADHSSNFIHIDPPETLFDPKALDLHQKIRTDQAKALTEGTNKTVSMYQAVAPSS